MLYFQGKSSGPLLSDRREKEKVLLRLFVGNGEKEDKGPRSSDVRESGRELGTGLNSALAVRAERKGKK